MKNLFARKSVRVISCLLAAALVTGLGYAVYVRLNARILVDWVDFVQWNGTSYTATSVPVPDILVGEKLGEVMNKMRSEYKGTKPPKTVDGDAAFLEVGTEFFAIDGYGEENYIAVETPDGYVAYRDHDSTEPEFAAGAPVDFGKIQYIRTNGYHEEIQYPQVKCILSLDGLRTYIDENKDTYFLSYENVRAPYGAKTWFDAAPETYGDEFFQNNMLIFVLLEEGSGSVSHTVTDVSLIGGVLTVGVTRHIPEMGTADMAEWHIVIEAPKEFYSEDYNVVLTEDRDEPTSSGITIIYD